MSTEAIKVSVGFPVYNGGDNVCEVLDELLNQTHQNIELIISDNCSTDSTESVCREYAAGGKKLADVPRSFIDSLDLSD